MYITWHGRTWYVKDERDLLYLLSGVAGSSVIKTAEVDTAETVRPTKAVEVFSHQSSAFLTRLVLNQNIRLEYDGKRKDRYGRTLAYVYLTDGTFVNAEMVRQGYGHAYTQFRFKYLGVS